MTTAIGETKFPADLSETESVSINKPVIPKGVGEAPTVLESSSQNGKSEKTIEPGVFETIVVAIKDFIVFLFVSLWNCLCKKENKPPQTNDPVAVPEALEISQVPSEK